MNATSLCSHLSLLVPATLTTACWLGGCGPNVSDKDIKLVSLAETRAMLGERAGSAKAIDARTPAEFAHGHIPGAMNLDLPEVPADKDSIDPALTRYKTLIVYGQDAGSPAPRAMVKRFLLSGHRAPRLFAGGMTEWEAAGLPVEKGAPVTVR